MTPPTARTACPRCGCDLVPVHRRQGTRRTVIALTCPEPYCGHQEPLRSTGGRATFTDLFEPKR